MSLLLNEDFTTYQLRLSYLQRIHDGVGERLITLNSAVLHNPAFRAAGWLPDTAASRRCYSPPIPTAGAGVASEYFKAPARALGTSLEDDGDGGVGHGGRTEENGGLTGLGISAKQRRRRRKEQMEEDDSSDLSDDSEEEELRPTATASSAVRFGKVPQTREQRSQSIPGGTLTPGTALEPDGPALMITSPSRPSEGVTPGLRRGSIGSVGGLRPRRDTTTSSDLSSENELDPNGFGRHVLGRPGRRHLTLAQKIAEEDQQEVDEINDEEEAGDSDLLDDEVDEASDLSDEFDVQDDASHSPRLMGLAVGGESADTSPIKLPRNIPPPITPHGHDQSSPRRQQREQLPKLAKLPPGKSISSFVPASLLSLSLRGNVGSTETPFQRFAEYSGKGEASPLWVKIYAPFSDEPSKPIEVPLRRTKDGGPIMVIELIGLALWRYVEEGYKPALAGGDTNVNRWTLRIIEDEEVDFDFPALGRTRPVTYYTSNNNRPPQRRARDKPWDEFGLVRATEEQFGENQQLTPQEDHSLAPLQPPTQAHSTESDRPIPARTETEASEQNFRPNVSSFNPARNPITGPSFAPTALRKESSNLLDQPQRENTQSTPRTGAPKTVFIHFTDPHSFAVSNFQVPTTTDTYIAELHDYGCKRLNLDKALYVLKVHGTQTVAPADRTVEALGERVHLDLVRRRFVGGGDGIFGLGLSGSPGSQSPNAPLELTTITTPTGGARRKKAFGLTSRAEQQQHQQHAAAAAHAASILTMGAAAFADAGKRYNVLRKQPLSFAAAHPRTLIISPEYLQILPAAPPDDSLAAPVGKVTNVPMAMIIGAKVSRKHPKMVRVLVFREREPKRYDFECASPDEAARVCSDIRRGTQGLREGGVA